MIFTVAERVLSPPPPTLSHTNTFSFRPFYFSRFVEWKRTKSADFPLYSTLSSASTFSPSPKESPGEWKSVQRKRQEKENMALNNQMPLERVQLRLEEVLYETFLP